MTPNFELRVSDLVVSSLYPTFSAICVLHVQLNHILFNPLHFEHYTCVLIEHKHTAICIAGIHYYQGDIDFEDKIFNCFWNKFLPKGYVAKKLKEEDPIPTRLFLVFVLPSVNRQNNVDVVSDFIRKTKDKLDLKGNR